MKAQIEFAALQVIVDATKEFVGVNDHRPIYQYICLKFSADDNEVTAVAVDGYRLSIERSICTVDEDFTVYIKPYLPRGSKKSFAVIELKDDFAYINVDGNVTGYKQPSGEFLDWENAIPKSESTYKIGFNGLYLLSALKAVKISARDVFRNAVTLELRGPKEPIILRTGKKGENIKMILPVRIFE